MWSDPANPNGMGGKPLPLKPDQKSNPELASVRGGHFTVPVDASVPHH
jgi:hypothetical protein